jgi:hypothetical protein
LPVLELAADFVPMTTWPPPRVYCEGGAPPSFAASAALDALSALSALPALATERPGASLVISWSAMFRTFFLSLPLSAATAVPPTESTEAVLSPRRPYIARSPPRARDPSLGVYSNLTFVTAATTTPPDQKEDRCRD